MALPPGEIQFSEATYRDGDTALVFVYDPDLSPPSSCSADWSDIPSPIEAFEWWNLATGEPHPDHYALNAGCPFDTASPSQTPLRPTIPFWIAKVDGVAALVGNFDPSLGRISFASAVNASSTVHALFEFDEVNYYPATSTVARIFSESDPEGEPVSLTEVSSESDPTPSAASALFRGAVTVSTDPGSQTPADGKVWVRRGDSLYVDYLGPIAGDAPVSSATADLVLAAPTPTPTPVPASGPISLAALGGAFIVLIWWRLTHPQRLKRKP